MTRPGPCVIGLGEVGPKETTADLPVVELLAMAGRRAITDAGLRLSDVDGLLVSPLLAGAPTAAAGRLAGYLGLTPTYLDLADQGGATAVAMLGRASAAIAAGHCRAVLCVLGDALDPKRFYASRVVWSGDQEVEFDRPYGPAGANGGYGLVARRHQHEYGTTDAQRAKVAVDQRYNAQHNPSALFHGVPLTVDDVLNSPIVAEPLRLLEIVCPCTGAIAFIVAQSDMADPLGPSPIAIAGYAERYCHNLLSEAPSLTSFPIVDTACRAFHTARVTPEDIDLICVYDCYTIAVVIIVEDAGFCPKGHGGPFLAERDLRFHGDFPLNTHGGQLSYGQAGLAGGATQVHEAVLQLRGHAGSRQVPECASAFVHGTGGLFNEQCSAILRRET